MIWYAFILLQSLALTIDELCFHRRRGLGAWERIGHPVDTFFFALCGAIALRASLSADPGATQSFFLFAGALSCLIITKDEPTHLKLCSTGEAWLHAVLFFLHPISLFALWMLALSHESLGIEAVLTATVLFMSYQFFYWNFIRRNPENGTIIANDQ